MTDLQDLTLDLKFGPKLILSDSELNRIKL